MDNQATESLIFDRAYCNQPVCSPSRNSFLFGRRPSTTEIWNFISSFREVGPTWVSLPGHFKQHGYLTLGTGKLFHPGHPANGDGNASWTDLPVQFACNQTEIEMEMEMGRKYHVPSSALSGNGQWNTTTQAAEKFYCLPACTGCNVPGTPTAPRPRWCAIDDVPLNGSTAGLNTTQIPPFCDTVTLEDGLTKLKYAAANRLATGQPFFVGVGFQKPHLDWRINWFDVRLDPQLVLKSFPPEALTETLSAISD